MAVITRMQAHVLHKRLGEHNRNHAVSTFELCRLLYEVYYSEIQIGNRPAPVWTIWGHRTWGDFVEKEVGLHESTAHGYKNVWDVWGVQLDGCWSKGLLLPITKMKILVNARLDKNNCEDWLKKAAGMTCDKLCRLIYGTPEYIQKTLSLQKEESEILHKAIELAREDFEEYRQGAALAAALEEWLKIRRTSRHLKKAS